jgi:hypothetical protein
MNAEELKKSKNSKPGKTFWAFDLGKGSFVAPAWRPHCKVGARFDSAGSPILEPLLASQVLMVRGLKPSWTEKCPGAAVRSA